MSLEIPDVFKSDIELYAEKARITSEEAVWQIVASGLRKASPDAPGWRLIGLFSSDEDSALMDEIVEIAYTGRSADTTRNLGP